MLSSSFGRFLALFAIAVALSACARTESYRYKLTLAVSTPAGVKRASSVVEVTFWDVSIPAKGTMHDLRGQALYLELGPGARPLIALLTRRIHPTNRPVVVIGPEPVRWTTEAGPGTELMSRLYGIAPSADFRNDVPRIALLRGAHRINPDDLPDLVTFANINDPASVIEVDPNDLQATLGPGVGWNEITLESTDEPITRGLELKLPWIPAYWCGMLDGDQLHHKTTLANTLSSWDFDQSDEARERTRQHTSHRNISYECWKSVTEWQQQHR